MFYRREVRNLLCPRRSGRRQVDSYSLSIKGVWFSYSFSFYFFLSDCSISVYRSMHWSSARVSGGERRPPSAGFGISFKHAEIVYLRIPSSAVLLAEQQLSGGEVALVLQQNAEVVHGDERVRMPIAEGLTLHFQRLA